MSKRQSSTKNPPPNITVTDPSGKISIETSRPINHSKHRHNPSSSRQIQPNIFSRKQRASLSSADFQSHSKKPRSKSFTDHISSFLSVSRSRRKSRSKSALENRELKSSSQKKRHKSSSDSIYRLKNSSQYPLAPRREGSVSWENSAVDQSTNNREEEGSWVVDFGHRKLLEMMNVKVIGSISTESTPESSLGILTEKESGPSPNYYVERYHEIFGK